MKTLKILFVALMMTTATSAHALEVEVKKTTNASVEAAWQEIGDWCGISTWHPAIEKCKKSIRDGVAYRTLFLKGGGEVFEKQIEFNNSAKSYSYIIEKSPLPIQNYSAEMKAIKNGTGSTLIWKARFDAKGATDEDAKKTISGVFEAGLNSIVDRLKK